MQTDVSVEQDVAYISPSGLSTNVVYPHPRHPEAVNTHELLCLKFYLSSLEVYFPHFCIY